MDYDVVIIGAGPAGLSAAVYLRRAGMNVAIIEKQSFSGGQMLLTGSVENYLGFPSITGDALADRFYKHAKWLGTDFIEGEVSAIDNQTVRLKNFKSIRAEIIVLAMGSTHKTLGLKNEKELNGKGISYCALCDGNFFKNRKVAVIGGGDTALEDAIYLSSICSSVTLIHRRDKLKGSKILQDKFFRMPNTHLLFNDEVREFKGDKRLKALVLKSGQELTVDGAFISIGQNPQNELVRGKVRLDTQGYIITDEYCRTSLHKVFAVGDIRSKNCRQIVTAVADGAIVTKGIMETI